jgi:LacI family transcriptional regulator
MTISAKEFARQIGLSTVTISRALNDDHRVNPETRQRVHKLAGKLGYQPNPMARALRKRHVPNIGLTVVGFSYEQTDLMLCTFGTFVQRLVVELAERGYNLVLGTMVDASSPESATTSLPRIVEERHVTRLILLNHMWPNVAHELIRRNIRSVVVNGPGCGLPVVQRDEPGAVTTMVDHLVGLGHRRIAFMGLSWVGKGFRDRIMPEAYVTSMAKHNLPPMPGWDQHHTPEQTVNHLFALKQPPTAIVAYDDFRAAELTRQLMKRGIAVPEQISVTAMLSHGPCATGVQRITCISTPQSEMAAATVRLLMDEPGTQVDAADTDAYARVIPGDLIRGETDGEPTAS